MFPPPCRQSDQAGADQEQRGGFGGRRQKPMAGKCGILIASHDLATVIDPGSGGAVGAGNGNIDRREAAPATLLKKTIPLAVTWGLESYPFSAPTRLTSKHSGK